MANTISPEVRSHMMAQVRSKDTKPELQVRRLLHGLGYRYRLHRADLPGKPDLVFPSKRKVIFVNGCFWHQHSDCERAHIPATNRNYWIAKLKGNQSRDAKNIASLEMEGWNVETVWECQLQDIESVTSQLVSFLDGTAGPRSECDAAAAL